MMGSPEPDGTKAYRPDRSAATTDAGAVPTNDPPATVDAATITGETAPVPRSGSRAFPAVPGYEVERELGRGGMGVVYLARHIALKRAVALKVIRSGDDASDDQLQRFRVEAEAVAQLQHPNIVQIYEVGEYDGMPFCALEYLAGGSLSGKLSGKPLHADAAAVLIETLARAMHHAHQKGIVHRDLKPANILLTVDGTPKVTDFGLAKRFEEGDSSLTRTGAVMGTPAYMAPEQAAGKVHEIGPAADIYALGVILYQMLTGTVPFKGESAVAVIQLLQTAEAPAPSRLAAGVPRDLETICLKCLQKEPGRRYTSALGLAQDVERFRAGEPILARREGMVRKAWRLVRRRGLVVGLSLALLLAAGVAAGMMYSASTTRRVTTLARDFDDQLDRADWPPGHADQLDGLVDQLRALDPDHADAAKRRLLDRAAKRIKDALAEPRITGEEVPRLEKELAWLAARDADSAARLARDLRDRLRAWQPVVDLTAPFAAAGDAFSSALVRVESATLRRAAPVPAVVPTKLSSRGNVRMSIEVAEGWETSRELGVVIHHQSGATPIGYYFVIVATPPPGRALDGTSSGGAGPSDNKPIDFRRTGRSAELRIVRNGVVLQRRAISIPAGPIKILAERNAGRLRAQVNDLPAITFTDPIPIPARDDSVIGLVWPDKATIARVRVDGSALPPAASRLEKADEAFDRGQIADALQLYLEQARSGGEIAVEAQCKAGLCQTGLNRLDEAARTFEDVMKQSGDQWPVVAAAQLWLIHLREKRYADADAVFAAVSVRFTRDQLAQYVPASIREELGQADRIPLMNHLIPDPKLIPRLEAMVRLADLLQLEGAHGYSGDLMIALALNRDYARATALAEQNLKTDFIAFDRHAGQPNEAVFWTLRWLCWTRRATGNARYAADFTDRLVREWRAKPASDAARTRIILATIVPFRLEQARCLAAAGMWPEAEAAVDEYLRDYPRPINNYVYYSQPYLLKGFMHARKGDEKTAQETWSQGLLPAFHDQLPASGRAPERIPKSSWGLLDYWIMASLTDKLPDESAAAIATALVSRLSSDPLMAQLGTTLQLPPNVVRGAWRSPRGRELARRVAFLDVEPIEFGRLPPVVLVYEKFRQDLFGGSPTPDQDDTCWQAARGSADAMFEGKLSKTHVLQLALAWKGTAGTFGWSGVAPQIAPDLRRPVAYVMGIRYLRLNRPTDAAGMFRMAMKDAAPDSPVAKLARQELDRIEKK